MPSKIKLFVCFSISLSIFASCSVLTRKPELPTTLTQKPIIIFVPGYKGSKLTDSVSGETVWLSLSEVLFGDKNLAINTAQFSLIKEDLLEEKGVLESISILPPLVSYNIYSGCLDSLRTNFVDQYDIKLFSYDWRRGANFNGRELLEFIASLQSSSNAPITVISHSMGGLVTTYAIKSGALVHSLIYFGTPFKGVLESFRDMNFETQPLLTNDTLLDKKAYNSFESAFDLMPESSEFSFIYDIENWEKHNWGLFSFRDDKNFNLNGIREYVGSNLRRAEGVHKINHSGISNDSLINKIRVLNVVGIGTPTLAKAEFTNDGVSFSGEKLLADGDGVVTIESATMPPYFNRSLSKEVLFKQNHLDLCLSGDVAKEVVEFLKMKQTPPGMDR
jgi:hypothetical protein